MRHPRRSHCSAAPAGTIIPSAPLFSATPGARAPPGGPRALLPDAAATNPLPDARRRPTPAAAQVAARSPARRWLRPRRAACSGRPKARRWHATACPDGGGALSLSAGAPARPAAAKTRALTAGGGVGSGLWQPVFKREGAPPPIAPAAPAAPGRPAAPHRRSPARCASRAAAPRRSGRAARRAERSQPQAEGRCWRLARAAARPAGLAAA
jgi:hypothetical protein